MKTTLEEALELLDRGWAVIPILPDTKRPAVKWGHYSDELKLPTSDEVIEWFERWPNANIAVITGPLSGLVIVDCDNEAALAEATRLGMTRTPVKVRTKKGWHFYFKFPDQSDWIKNRVGGDGNDVDWPRCDGLDLRGSKGYAVAPPSKNYEWVLLQGHDFDDLPLYSAPVLNAPSASENVVDFNQWKFEGMSLSDVTLNKPIWDRTQELVDAIGKLPDGGGNGRDDRLYKYISSLAGQGRGLDALIDGAADFMGAFFQNDVEIEKVSQMCQRALDNEVRKGNLPMDLEPAEEEKEEDKKRKYKPITTADLDELREYVAGMEFYIDPIVPTKGTILQVFGYSGHGKSMFVRHLLYAAAAGQHRFGPFDLGQKSRVLYFDFENSRANIANFLDRSKRSFGDAGDNFMIWAPFNDEHSMNLMTEEGVRNFQSWIKAVRPTHVVIDTIRSAFPGLQENSAEQWSHINQMCLKMRNAGLAVWLLHHSNKPSEGTASGREAGSSNQLTVLETQIKITQVFWDKETAEVKAGIFEGDIAGSPFQVLSSKPAISDDERLDVMMQVRFGKVREWSDAHEPFYNLAFAGNMQDDTVRIVSGKTSKQRAMTFASQWTDAHGVTRPALSDVEIARRVGRPVSTIAEWTEKLREDLPSYIANAQ